MRLALAHNSQSVANTKKKKVYLVIKTKHEQKRESELEIEIIFCEQEIDTSEY